MHSSFIKWFNFTPDTSTYTILLFKVTAVLCPYIVPRLRFITQTHADIQCGCMRTTHTYSSILHWVLLYPPKTLFNFPHSWNCLTGSAPECRSEAMFTVIESRRVTSYPAKKSTSPRAFGVASPKDVLTIQHPHEGMFTAYHCVDAPGYRLRGDSLLHGFHPTMQALVFDLDPDTDDIDAFKAKILPRMDAIQEDWGTAFATYETRKGYRMVWLLKNPPKITDALEAQQWSDWYASRVDAAAAHGLYPDILCRDWTRLFRAPRCMRDGVPQTFDAQLNDDYTLLTYEPPPARVRVASLPETDGDELCTELAKLYAPEGSRHEYRLALIGWLIRHDLTDQDVLSIVNLTTLLAGSSVTTTLEGVQRTRERIACKEPTTGFTRLVELSTHVDSMEGHAAGLEATRTRYEELRMQHLEPRFRLSKKGTVLPTPYNAERLLRDHPAVRGSLQQDTLRDELVWTRDVLLDGRRLSGAYHDNDVTTLQCWAEDRYGVTFPVDTLRREVDSIARSRQFNVAQDYLNSLTWDPSRTSRIGELLQRAFEPTDDPEYVRIVSRCFMIALCARILDPGCVSESVLIIEGNQGIGKSSFFRNLLPIPSWYRDSFVMGWDSKLLVENTRGYVLCESAELTHSPYTNKEKIKDFISSRGATVRMAYGRQAQYYPRGFTLVGTTNETQYLTDPTGARRFWPIHCPYPQNTWNPNIVSWLNRHRDDLFAEATYYAREGVKYDPVSRPAECSWTFPSDRIELQQRATSQRYRCSSEEEAMVSALEQFSTPDVYRYHMQLSELHTACQDIYPGYRPFDTSAREFLVKEGYVYQKAPRRGWVHVNHAKTPLKDRKYLGAPVLKMVK